MLYRESNSLLRKVPTVFVALLIGWCAGCVFSTDYLEAEESAIGRLGEDLVDQHPARVPTSQAISAEPSISKISTDMPTAYIRSGVMTERLRKGDKVNYLFKSYSEAFGAGDPSGHFLIAEGTICNLEGNQASVYWRSIQNIRSMMAWTRIGNSDQWGIELLGDCDTSATKLPELKNVVPQS